VQEQQELLIQAVAVAVALEQEVLMAVQAVQVSL
jgi:hypothetical protein